MAFVQASEFELITSGLGYPEGPVYEPDGNVYVAAMLPEGNTRLSNGGIAVISPDGKSVDFMEINIAGKFAPLPSNLCFGGPDRKNKYVTCGASGLLVKAQVHVPGLALNFNRYL